MPNTISQANSINTALLGLARRAESVDRQKLIETFVDVGPLIALLSSRDHQIIYGRRGTGKTHALLYTAESARSQNDVAVYVDLRFIGSSGGVYSDPRISLPQRATRLLIDVLTTVHEELLGIAIDTGLDLSKIGPALDGLASSLTEVQVVGDVHRETRIKDSARDQQSAVFEANLQSSPGLRISSRNETDTSSETERRLDEAGELRNRVHFGSVSKGLRDLMETLEGRRLIIVLDEWSTLPLDLQPYLADLVRRAIFPVSRVTVKIAAIEQRSNFKLGASADYIGIEIGADASADVDLDDYMVFDNNTERAVEFFRELLFKHYISSDSTGPRFENSHLFIQAAFTQINAFEDFVRSAEGVPRDAFNVLMIAAQRNVNERISIPTVRIAARTWYQRDKEGAIRSDALSQRLLHWIVDEVIAHRRARAFLLQANTRHPLIDALFDARLLHIIKRSISANDHPGVRYDAYKLDYGCYVELLATSKAPEKLFATNDDDEIAASITVPPDDYRAIRRAILTLEDFEQSSSPGAPS